MTERIVAFLKQLRDLWAALPNAKRIAVVVGAVATVVLVFVASVVGSQERWAYLFTDLGPEDAAAIGKSLKEAKIPFRVEAGGTAIQVPEERVHETRLDLAGRGLPRGGGVGFEIFDKSHLGATEFEQRINLRRALEGELSRTIATVGAVQSARVHLVLPERSVFATAREKASASVVLRLRPGRTFGKQEVAGVVHLVASAVPGLGEDHVSVVSAEGLTLHRPRSDGPGGATTGDAVEREREIGSALEEQARSIVERVVGAGHADVRVGVELDPSQRDRTEERFEPNKTALRSEQRTDERGGGESGNVAGVPGAQSNLPDGDTEPAEGAGTSGLVRRSWTRNWEIDRVTERTTTPPGRVARLSVAVLVDGTYSGADRRYLARSQEELDRLAELVKGSIGFSATRGDTLRVESAPFARVEGIDAPVPAARRWRPWWIAVAAGAAAVVLASLLVLAVRGRRKAAQRAAARLGAAPVPAAIAGATSAPALPSVERLSGDQARAHALEIAARDPATAAVILREWLAASALTAGAPAPAPATAR